MKTKTLNLKNKLKDFKLCYTTDELRGELDSLTEDTQGIFSNNKRMWLHNNDKPKVISQIVEQVTKYFKISETHPRVCVHYPGDVHIKEQSINIMNRVIISSIDETPEITISGASDKINMSNWTAYMTPPMSSSIMSIEFDNSKVMTTVARKGHRAQRKVRHIENRFIIVIDYILSDVELNNVSMKLIEQMRSGSEKVR